MRYLTEANLRKVEQILIAKGFNWCETHRIAEELLESSRKKGGLPVETLIEQLPAPKQRSPSNLPPRKKRMKRLYAAANPENWGQYTTFADLPGVLLVNRNAQRSRILPFPTFCTEKADMTGLLNFVCRNSTSPTTA